MDALILTCGTGGGHDSACAAVEQALTDRGHRVTVLNPYTLRGGHTAAAVDEAYIFLAQRAPYAFGMVYQLGNAYRRLPVQSPVYYVNHLMAPLLEAFLRDNHFDAVVTTHLFPGEILTNLKREGKKVPPVYFIATDYTCIPFTEETDCDRYIIPAEALREEFAERGIPESRIVPLGIPVQRHFHRDADRAAARTRLGMRPDKKYILVAGGSIGAGKIVQVVSILARHYDPNTAELIVICGNNRALRRTLERSYGGRCTLLDFTPQIADYITACDLFVSKPGGLSSTEAAVVGTALVHITPIPGCETHNMRFFAENGMCAPVSAPGKQLVEACDRLLDEKERARMIENQKKVIRPDAADAICALLEAECAKAGEQIV